MTTDIKIRPYSEADKGRLLKLLELNTPAYFSTEERKDFMYYLDNEIEQYFVVELDGEIVGCGGINFAEDNTAGRISWDLLHPSYQGKGIGSRLLQHRIAVLQSIGDIKSISVRTSQLAWRFYEKNGFRLTEIVEDYWAEGYDLYRMEYRQRFTENKRAA